MDACATDATKSRYSQSDHRSRARYARVRFLEGSGVIPKEMVTGACALGATKKQARRISHRSRARYARVRFLEGR